MKRNLTATIEPITMALVGKTDASNAEEQLVRDSQLKAMNCRWDGSNTSAIPFYELQGQFRALKCLKKPDKNSPAKGGFSICKRQEKSLNCEMDLSDSR